jgi:hypothetical protein
MSDVDFVLAINVAIHEQALEDTATVRAAHANTEMGILCYRSWRTDASMEVWPLLLVVVVVVIVHLLQCWLVCL